MKTSISEIVGRAEDAQGKEVSVYQALRPLLCAQCGKEIKVDELFNRRKLGSIRISPRCRECSPFGQLNNTNYSSSLIEFLLKPEQPHGKAAKTSALQRYVWLPVKLKSLLKERHHSGTHRITAEMQVGYWGDIIWG